MRKLAIAITSFCLFIGFGSAYASTKEGSEIEKLNFGVEVGAHVLTKDVTPPENVRFGERGSHAYYIPWQIGINAEYLFGNCMFGISSGIRLTTYTAFFGKDEWNTIYEWNVAPETEEGDYVFVHKIKQANNYLGVPLMFRIFFNPHDKIVRPYFKLDLAFNFLVANKNTIEFAKEGESLDYVDKINKNLGDPEKFNSTLDFSYGLRIGRDPFYVNAELHFPSFLLTDSPVSFFNSTDLTMLNFGVKVAMQVPIAWGEYLQRDKDSAKAEEKIQSEYAPSPNDFEQQPLEDDSNGVFTPAE